MPLGGILGLVFGLLPIFIFLLIVLLIIRAKKKVVKRMMGRGPQNQQQRPTQGNVQQRLQGLFEGDQTGTTFGGNNQQQQNNQPQTSAPRSMRCPGCGANMTARGDRLQCDFCGSSKR